MYAATLLCVADSRIISVPACISGVPRSSVDSGSPLLQKLSAVSRSQGEPMRTSIPDTACSRRYRMAAQGMIRQVKMGPTGLADAASIRTRPATAPTARDGGGESAG